MRGKRRLFSRRVLHLAEILVGDDASQRLFRLRLQRAGFVPQFPAHQVLPARRADAAPVRPLRGLGVAADAVANPLRFLHVSRQKPRGDRELDGADVAHARDHGFFFERLEQEGDHLVLDLLRGIRTARRPFVHFTPEQAFPAPAAQPKVARRPAQRLVSLVHRHRADRSPGSPAGAEAVRRQGRIVEDRALGGELFGLADQDGDELLLGQRDRLPSGREPIEEAAVVVFEPLQVRGYLREE